MKVEKFENLLHIKHHEGPGAFLMLNDLSMLKNYRSVDITLSIYPKTANLDASSFEFDPYEVYISNIHKEKETTYVKIVGAFDKLFGILVSLTLAIGFALFYPVGLESTQGVISILGAFFVAKDFWKEIEKGVIHLTRKSKISFKSEPYSYIKRNLGESDHFLESARMERFQNNFLLPFKYDLISNTNSKILKLFYLTNEVKSFGKLPYILCHTEFKKDTAIEDYIISVEIGLLKSHLGIFQKKIQVMQCLKEGEFGTFDNERSWVKDMTTVRTSINMGRIEMDWGKRSVTSFNLINVHKKLNTVLKLEEVE